MDEPLLDILAAHPGRLAVCDPDGKRTCYGELHRAVRSVAAHLLGEGMQPGHRVVLQVPNGAEFAAAAMGVLLAGGVPVFCEPGIGRAAYLAQMKAAQPRWVLVHPLLLRAHSVPGLVRLLARREIDIPPLLAESTGARTVRLSRADIARWTLRSCPDGDAVTVSRRPEDEAVLVFTGGTVASPRGVRLSHHGLAEYFERIRTVIEGCQMERLLADTPQQLLYALRLGRSVYATRGRKERRARHILRLVRQGAVDSYFGSPYIWIKMMDLERAGGRASARLPARLRTVLLGSAPVTPAFLRLLSDFLHPDTRVLCLYGLTEAGPVCLADASRKAAWTAGGDWVGQPISGVRLRIQPLDQEAASEAALPDPAKPPIGEVIVHSPALFSGYLGEAARAPEEGLRTGDLGYLHHGGNGPELVLVGRSKDMIIRRSVNIYPATLEPVLLDLADDRGPLLDECALVGCWNAQRQDEDVVLCARPAQGRSGLHPGDLASRVRVALGPDGAPDQVLLVDRLPRTGRQNKLDRGALRRMAAARTRPAGASRPAGPDLPWSYLPALKIPFRWDQFFRKYRILFRHEPAAAAVASHMALRLTLWAAAQTAWSLDELLARGWRGVSMRGPLFILGHQRSGTTFLHRLLAQDRAHSRALALHEMLLPATVAQRGLGWVERLDTRFGRPLGRRLDGWQERFFGPLDPIHRVRFQEAEEDELVLWGIFASIMCANDAPCAAAMAEMDELRDFHSWPQPKQARALGYYRACLLKKVMREPGPAPENPPWIVSKNPAFTHKTAELLRVFPDARFVYLIRSPLEAIPSRLSLIRSVWRQRFPGFHEMQASHVETILADSVRTYLAGERDIVALPADRRQIVTYAQLMEDPRGVVERIYSGFGLPGPDAALRAALDKGLSAGRDRTSPHRYSLEEFGLTEARLRHDLAPVFERFDF